MLLCPVLCHLLYRSLHAAVHCSLPPALQDCFARAFMLLCIILCHLLCRSLGLTLLEAVNGRYTYDAYVGPLQLMIQVRCFCSISHLKPGKGGGAARCTVTLQAQMCGSRCLKRASPQNCEGSNLQHSKVLLSTAGPCHRQQQRPHPKATMQTFTSRCSAAVASQCFTTEL